MGPESGCDDWKTWHRFENAKPKLDTTTFNTNKGNRQTPCNSGRAVY